MIRSILVPLDGSRFAEAALAAAVPLARAARAGLRLVHVHQPVPGQPVASPEVPVTEAPADWARRAREEAYLADLAMRAGAGLTSVEFEVCDGRPAEALCRCVAERSPDLVVLSTHGRGSASPLWIGSVADYLVRTATVPLLLVRPDGGGPPPDAAEGFRSVLALVDLSEESSRILEPLTAFACLTQAHVTLLHVVRPEVGVGGEPGPPYPAAPGNDAELAARCAEAQRELDRLADRLRARGVRAAARVAVGADVAGTILREATSGPVQLLALTTHGAGGHRERLIGSVADKVIRGAGLPVLVLRPPPEASS